MTIQLVDPSLKYESSYRTYISELGDEPRIPFTLSYPCDEFDQLVDRLHREAKGIDLPDGFVAHSTYWLVHEMEIVGVSNLRHSLTPALRIMGGHIGYGVRPAARRRGYGKELLRLTIERAVGLGLSRLLLSCDKNNVASACVIAANNGLFEGESIDAETNNVIQRYWIDAS